MSSIHTSKVLVLNRNWQGIGVVCGTVALCDVVRGVATAIDTDTMTAVRWEDWIRLPVREDDIAVHSAKLTIRMPTVICKSSYAKMPKRRPRLDRSAIARRDNFICQYTGEYSPDGNVDHVQPVSRGGGNTWDNLVWSRRELNSMKGSRTPAEAGLKLLKAPAVPKEQPVCATIRPDHPDWRMFLG